MKPRLRVAVLAYHSQDIQGNDYGTNDHVALAEDVRLVARLGLTLVSADRVVAALAGRATIPSPCVAFTCDDGAVTDFDDVDDAVHGRQRSFFNIMASAFGPPSRPLMTSFVIGDPESRRTLELTCLQGRPWLSETWWPRAVATGRWHIGCHSWDHHHPTLGAYAGLAADKAMFRSVDHEAEAARQVGQAVQYIRSRAPNPGDRLFAYPYGNWTDYLANEYLPASAGTLGLSAAFTTQPEVLHDGSDRWKLPRFVCRSDWNTPEGLERILRQL
jgi:peptidoglycan/xylan/chitin deacetylase (PgdA/CDA1 family)